MRATQTVSPNRVSSDQVQAAIDMEGQEFSERAAIAEARKRVLGFLEKLDAPNFTKNSRARCGKIKSARCQ